MLFAISSLFLILLILFLICFKLVSFDINILAYPSYPISAGMQEGNEAANMLFFHSLFLVSQLYWAILSTCACSQSHYLLLIFPKCQLPKKKINKKTPVPFSSALKNVYHYHPRFCVLLRKFGALGNRQDHMLAKCSCH